MAGRRCLGFLLIGLLWAQAACGGLMLGAAAAPSARGPSAGFNLFSPEQDIELGRASAEEAVRDARLVEDPRVNAYVRRVGARLAARAPGYGFPYHFAVVAAPEVNAFAFPGGFVFINAGAVEAAQSEGELAAILAHEISHVALRHGTNQASKAYVTKAGLEILDTLTGGRNSRLGRLVASFGAGFADRLFLDSGRTSETEADLEGARLMAASGYDPRDMARFFVKLDQKGAARAASGSDHPDPVARVAAINQMISTLPPARVAQPDPEEFRQIKRRLRGF